MDRDRLFVDTIKWLADTVNREPLDEHRMLLSSGRLRMLLLDASPLIDQVNRDRRFDIRYRIVRHGGSIAASMPELAGDLVLHATADGLYPGFVPPGHTLPVENVKKTAFLHEWVLTYRGVDVNVRDLITHTANVAGGVHAGVANTEREAALNELGEMIVVQGIDAGIRCLRGISAVVVDVVIPLVEAIEAGE